MSKDTFRLRSKHFPTQLLSSGARKTAGVAILVSRRFRGTLGVKIAEIRGRLLAYKFQFGGHSLTIATVYAPNSGQEAFLLQAVAAITHSPDDFLLIGRDLNIVFDNVLDIRTTVWTDRSTVGQGLSEFGGGGTGGRLENQVCYSERLFLLFLSTQNLGTALLFSELPVPLMSGIRCNDPPPHTL